MSKNINDASLANLKHYEGKWQSGATRTIRVPITLADATLEYARQLDNSIKSVDTSDLTNEVEQLKREIERLQSEVGNLSTENEALRQELVEARQQYRDSLIKASEASEEAVRDLRLQLKAVQTELELGDLMQPWSPEPPYPVRKSEPLEAAELLNQLKAKRKKSTASFADIEAVLEILEKLTPKGN